MQQSLRVPYIPSTAQEEVELMQRTTHHEQPSKRSRSASPGEMDKGPITFANDNIPGDGSGSLISVTASWSEHSQNANAAVKPDVGQPNQANDDAEHPSDDGHAELISAEEIEHRKDALFEHFRQGVAFFQEELDTINQKEAQIYEETSAYVESLKKTHRIIFQRSGMLG